jgi:hypothetical protein
MTTSPDKLLSIARETTPERQPDPGQVWKCGDEFLPFHPQASHVPAGYRDGWNRCYFMAMQRAERIRQEERERGAEFVLELLVAAGIITREKAFQTRDIARGLSYSSDEDAIRSISTTESKGERDGA